MNCNHSGCDCTGATIERNGKSYCSQACATGAATASASSAECGCGHPGCGHHAQESSGSFSASSSGTSGVSAPSRNETARR